MRIRTIKPEFWTHPIMSRLSAESQLLAIALLNYADDDGYFLADANLIRAACRPLHDSGTITVLMRDLIRAEWVQVSWNESRGPIGKVAKFKDHQVVNHSKPSKISKYWGIAYEYGNNPVSVPDDSGNVTTRNGMDQGREGKGREGAELTGAPDSTEEEDMGKKKVIVQEGLIPPMLMESPEFMEAWTGFLEMRREIKKPATEYAQKLLLRKLSEMSGNNIPTAIAILEQSVTSSWQDVYPLKTIGSTKTATFPMRGRDESDRPDLDFLPTGTDR